MSQSVFLTFFILAFATADLSEQVQQAVSPVESSPKNPKGKPSILNGKPLYRVASEAPWSIFCKRETELYSEAWAAFLSPLTPNI